MEHTVRLSEFDDVKSGNTIDIKDIMERIIETAPNGARVAWTYPGYISINLIDDREIAFGESLESDTGYSWNDFDSQGCNTYADSFDDLKDINAIVNKLWEQTSHLIGGNN
jgi:hypothetical protein